MISIANFGRTKTGTQIFIIKKIKVKPNALSDIDGLLTFAEATTLRGPLSLLEQKMNEKDDGKDEFIIRYIVC